MKEAVKLSYINDFGKKIFLRYLALSQINNIDKYRTSYNSLAVDFVRLTPMQFQCYIEELK